MPDGFVDLIGGAPGWSQNVTTPEYADVYSGRDGSRLHRFTWYGPSFVHYARAVVGVGDVNADGYDDVAVGIPISGPLFAPGGFDLFSGRDGSMLLPVREAGTGGDALDGAGDLGGDGTPDVVVGSWLWQPNPGTSPHQVGIVRVYSGKTGAKICELPGQNSGDRFGWSVASIGDLDSDGTPELVIGAPQRDNKQLGADVGRVFVYSGKTMQKLYHVNGVGADDELGYAVAGVGELDGDGLDDFAAGAPQLDIAFPAPGCVRVYSGADGALIHHLVTPDFASETGRSVCGPGDMNGDGTPDIAVGSPGFDQGTQDWVDVFSGADGSPILSLVSLQDFGHALAPIGDVNSDGLSDLAIGARWLGGQRQGAAYVWAGGPGPGVYCQAKLSSQGCLPSIASAGTPSVSAGGFVVSADQIVSNRHGLLFWGVTPQADPFDPGVLCVAPPIVRTPVQFSAGDPPPDDCSGSFAYRWTPAYVAGKGLSAGDSVYAQYVYLDPGTTAGAGMTDALHFVPVP